MNKFTTTEFYQRFPNDDACLHHLWTLRYGNMTECPECKGKTDYKKVKDRRSYQCSMCSNQIYPTQGTIFEKTTTPMLYWYWAIYMFTTTRNGVAAKELERQFDICYKTALRMAHQIKILISQQPEQVMTGIVEADATVFGHKTKFKHVSERAKYKTKGERMRGKTTVFGMLERSGEIVTRVVAGETKESVIPAILEKVAPESILVTDSAKAYHGINKLNIKHYAVNHDNNEWVRGILHTNTIEGFWSQVKRTIIGTHIHVSVLHMPKYLNECAFRYKMRNRQDEMFNAILSRV